jgi:hypothetical protein
LYKIRWRVDFTPTGSTSSNALALARNPRQAGEPIGYRTASLINWWALEAAHGEGHSNPGYPRNKVSTMRAAALPSP